MEDKASKPCRCCHSFCNVIARRFMMYLYIYVLGEHVKCCAADMIVRNVFNYISGLIAIKWVILWGLHWSPNALLTRSWPCTSLTCLKSIALCIMDGPLSMRMDL